MAKRYRVTLAAGERERLRRLISSGKGAARRLAHDPELLLDRPAPPPLRPDRNLRPHRFAAQATSLTTSLAGRAFADRAPRRKAASSGRLLRSGIA